MRSGAGRRIPEGPTHGVPHYEGITAQATSQRRRESKCTKGVHHTSRAQVEPVWWECTHPLAVGMSCSPAAPNIHPGRLPGLPPYAYKHP